MHNLGASDGHSAENTIGAWELRAAHRQTGILRVLLRGVNASAQRRIQRSFWSYNRVDVEICIINGNKQNLPSWSHSYYMVECMIFTVD